MTLTTTPTVDYGHVESTAVHLDDLDLVGIVHNARYALLVERAITAYWAQHGFHFDNGVPSHSDMYAAVAEYSVKFHIPVRGTNRIGIHFWLDRLGGSSAVYGFRVVSADGTTVHATGHRVLVKLDPKTLRPAAWSDEARAIAAKLLRPAEVG